MAFATINSAFANTFTEGKLSIGLSAPVESYPLREHPNLESDIETIQLAERLGFKAVWLRDIPFEVDSFGDVGQIYDPWVYLGYLAAQTESINLGIASLILPLRHPAHVAKAAASVDSLSGGRLLLGVASGDRPDEYPAMNKDFDGRGDWFASSVDYIRAAGDQRSSFGNSLGQLNPSMDLIPKPSGTRIPIMATGSSRQSTNWIAENCDGWIVYPRDTRDQQRIISEWENALAETAQARKPILQSLYVDLLEEPTAPPSYIHLGYSTGIDFLVHHLSELAELGMNHVMLNVRFNQRPIDETLEELAEGLFPTFA